jgi:hypothetical protein
LFINGEFFCGVPIELVYKYQLKVNLELSSEQLQEILKESSYKEALYKLSEAWSKIIYHTEGLSKEDQSRLYQFGEWIHNYRARLQMYYPYDFPEAFFDYYEQMLSITHEFLDSGNLSRYYGIVKGISKKDGQEYWISEKYVWTTEEDLGIQSKILPRYLPVNFKMIVDDKAIYDVINSGYNAVFETQEQRDEWFEFWKTESKPVLEILNQKNRDSYSHTVGASTIYKVKEV